MRKNDFVGISVEIDKITNSIQHALTGAVLETKVERVFPFNVAQIKKSKWLFDWNREVMDNGREAGYDGYVMFVAKTKLIAHYESTIGATLFSGNRMVIETPAALSLVKTYFRDYEI